MNKKIFLRNTEIEYDLQYKKVKNINLRISREGLISVSANKKVPEKYIEDFIISKADFILNALEKCKAESEISKKKYFEENEIRDVILDVCKRVYPYFENRGVKFPQVKFRKMVSCWGNCRSLKGILTFNTNLMYAPVECIQYVVLHEFTHFLQPNHSKKFYEELEKVCPDWKICKKMLKDIIL